MNDEPTKQHPTEQLPSSYWIGEELDWEADSISVVLFVELPFWLMVPDCSLVVEVEDHTFQIEIRSWLYALHANEVSDSQISCIHIGPENSSPDPESQRQIDEQQIPVLRRKCKTVLRIHSTCNSDALCAAREEEGGRSRAAHWYLKALCEAHIKVVNDLVQHYRLLTYDYFPYEVSPWDVPVWFVEKDRSFTRIVLFEYASWDRKPLIRPAEGQPEIYKLTTPTDLQAAMPTEVSAGELELLDAINLMERGDYSGAVRRITTAIEAILEQVLREELSKRYSEAEVEAKLNKSRPDFPGRLRQYQKLSGRKLPEKLNSELEATREIRHDIVHRGRRVSYTERGRAQRSVDTGRWIFNWLEDRPDRSTVRERKIGMRSIGRHFNIFEAEITSYGAVVHKPPLLPGGE